MNIKTLLSATYQILTGWRKANLIKAVLELRDKYLQAKNRADQLEKENTELKKQLEQEKIKATNKQVNKPSSKHAEWEKEGRTGKDKGKKKRKGRKRKAHRGAGNRPKNIKRAIPATQ